MEGTEKATYLIFGRGHDPERLRLGNLVMSPYSPDESDPYICPYTLDDLHEWTGKSMEEPELNINRVDSSDKGGFVKLTSLVGGDVSRSKGSTLKVEGKNARRFQIHQANEFLKSVILSSDEAKKWLNARITLSKNMLLLSRLKTGKSRHPQIWMVTGVQMLSNATVYSDRTGSAKTGVNLQVPTPELAAVALAAVGQDGKLADGEISFSKGGQSNVDYRHEDERVWAAQFRRLKLDFVRDDASQSESEKEVSLENLLHLGLKGMKDARPAIDETRRIDGLCAEDVAMEDEKNIMTEEEATTFKGLRAASGNHALLIGGSEQSLNGVRRDLEAMWDLLIGRGFNVSLCYGAEATRNGIIEAWRALIERVSKGSGDAVVVYYSGHGGASVSQSSSESYRIQYLLPFDIEKTTETDFRGILDVELSHLVNCLTERTHNVTIIADCCHSERIARRPETPGTRAWSPLERGVIDKHITRLRDAGLFKNQKIEGNRYAIRVVAAESDQAAFEAEAGHDMTSRHLSSSGSNMGRLTRELVRELKAIGRKKTSWDVVLPQLRFKLENPQSMFQRPTIEGPRMRVLFSLDRMEYLGALRVRTQDDGVRLMGGGVLAGVRKNDQYAIMPRTAMSPDQDEQIAVARVTDVWPTKGVAELEYCGDHGELPSGALAFPLRRFQAYRVAVQVSNTKLATDLQARLDKSGIRQGQNSFATIKQDGDKLFLIRREKELVLEYPMLTASTYGDAVNELVFQLEKLITADRLLKLAPEDDEDAIDMSSVSYEIGLVQNGHTKPFQDTEHSVKEGEEVYLIIQNGGNSTLYASVFLVTSMGTIEWRSYGSPSGAEIRPRHEYAPGQVAHGQKVTRKRMIGQQHLWPALVPRGEPLEEAYVVVLTSGKADLGFWENIDEKLDQGQAREPGKNKAIEYDNDLRFGVLTIGFELKPK